MTDPGEGLGSVGRSWRTVALALLAILAAGGVVVLIGALMKGDDAGDPPAGSEELSEPEFGDIVAVARAAGVGNPRRPELPDPEDPEPTVAYLDADGAVLLEQQQTVVSLFDREPPSDEQCRAAATSLDELGSPTELYGRGEATPDPVLAELFVSLSASTSRFLSTCDAGDEEKRGELAYQWVLVQRRLDQLGVPR